jgi:hypothetical protein
MVEVGRGHQIMVEADRVTGDDGGRPGSPDHDGG